MTIGSKLVIKYNDTIQTLADMIDDPTEMIRYVRDEARVLFLDDDYKAMLNSLDMIEGVDDPRYLFFPPVIQTCLYEIVNDYENEKEIRDIIEELPKLSIEGLLKTSIGVVVITHCTPKKLLHQLMHPETQIELTKSRKIIDVESEYTIIVKGILHGEYQDRPNNSHDLITIVEPIPSHSPIADEIREEIKKRGFPEIILFSKPKRIIN